MQITSCLWPPNHKFVDGEILGVTDPDGDLVTITITAITSDEPTATDKGSGGAKHAPDASGVGTAGFSVDPNALELLTEEYTLSLSPQTMVSGAE